MATSTTRCAQGEEAELERWPCDRAEWGTQHMALALTAQRSTAQHSTEQHREQRACAVSAVAERGTLPFCAG
eukprot:742990-Rhodomonas_salina.1